MSLIAPNLGNIVVGTLIILILAYALRNLIKSFGQCTCHCANCPKEIAQKCHCQMKENKEKVEE